MGVYLIYLFSQILILAALMLTTTNMIIHILAMCLTILFYFMVSFTDVTLISFSPAFILPILSQTTKMPKAGPKIRRSLKGMSEAFIVKMIVSNKKLREIIEINHKKMFLIWKLKRSLKI
jgi:hypothetical protein